MICNQEFPDYRTDLSNLYILTISLVCISPVLNRYLKTWSGFWFLVFLSTPLSESKHRSLWLTITLEHHNSVLSTAKLSSFKIIQPLHFYLYCMCKSVSMSGENKGGQSCDQSVCFWSVDRSRHHSSGAYTAPHHHQNECTHKQGRKRGVGSSNTRQPNNTDKDKSTTKTLFWVNRSEIVFLFFL